MTVLLVEVPVSLVQFDVRRFPDKDDRHIPEHLLRYFEKFEPLPAITVSLDEGALLVTRGHKYLEAAKALGRPRIRAVVASRSEAEARRAVSLPGVTVLDWEAIKEEEANEPVPKGWHVFFFERVLSADEKAKFAASVAALFAGLDSSVDVVHDDRGPSAEFEARTPVTDRAWVDRHLSTFRQFSENVARIVSYQGARFDAGA